MHKCLMSQRQQKISKDSLVPSDPRYIGQVCRQSSSFVVVSDGDGLGRLDIIAGQKILKLRCADSRQDLSAP
jgi:hypothetical protein